MAKTGVQDEDTNSMLAYNRDVAFGYGCRFWTGAAVSRASGSFGKRKKAALKGQRGFLKSQVDTSDKNSPYPLYHNQKKIFSSPSTEEKESGRLLPQVAPNQRSQGLTVGNISVATSSSAASEQDSLALVALYNSTGGGGWNDNNNWLNDPVGSWVGVSLDENGRVDTLLLHSNNLQGTIPTELGDLTEIKMLWLEENELNGTIPPELGNLTNAHSISLANNQLFGQIPDDLGNLTSLVSLWLWGNQLEGEIPVSLTTLPNVVWLSLSLNQLSGPIPSEIGNLTTLETLHLQSNKFYRVYSINNW